MMLRKLAWCALLAAGIGFLCGCSKLQYKNWQTLTLQSSKMEVATVLGEPNKWKKEEAWMYHDGDRQVTVNCEFVGGDNLTYSRWVDPQHGVHEIGRAAIEGTDLIDRDTRKTDINQ